MNSFNNIEELIGNTPLMELAKISALENINPNFKIFAKLEFMNPAGSIKDRAALHMIRDAEDSGKLDASTVIVEPTSGNTGIGLAAISATKGYPTIIVMPDNMSKERIDSMKAYGAEVVLTPACEGMKGSIAKANSITQDLRLKNINTFIPDQFANPANAQAHYLTTGPEIFEALEGRVDAFVAGIGTGGTITGIGKFLKEKNRDAKVFGMEPASSPILTNLVAGKSEEEAVAQACSHKIQGIGANFIPKLLDVSLLDSVICVDDKEAYKYTRLLATKESLFAGISSGANVAAAIKVVKVLERQGYIQANIVTVLPDGGAKYMSTGVFDE